MSTQNKSSRKTILDIKKMKVHGRKNIHADGLRLRDGFYPGRMRY